ncbi:hypothetical protein SAMN04489712_10138 [Thermomonospora echinospora]|uniref:Uncharacterized protein n=1 Tax=Thermomonospora echinospora TaxID=1992 RepID=A0A1H5S128_9ACTN|nr:hypothetical protein [Thermomonospora echinospora]SEF44323.1 hypothetical protein SAMN04489712_10138 [Thermomonospora echinospora]
MSSTVEIYLRGGRDAAAVVQQVATALDVRGYFGSGEGYVLTLSSEPWTTGEGVASLDLGPTDEDLVGALGETAYSPYDFRLSIELRGAPGLARAELRERLGRQVFDRLTALRWPMALGDAMSVFADFLPGRGVREFPPDTDWEEAGHDIWFEPRLHGTEPPASRQPPEPLIRGAATVFETNGLVQFLACDAAGAKAPVASIRSEAGATLLGRTLAEVLRYSAKEIRTGQADPWSWLTGIAKSSPDEYARSAVSLAIRLENEQVTAVPHRPHPGDPAGHVVQGPAIEALTVHRPGPWDDTAMGELVLGLLAAARGSVPA